MERTASWSARSPNRSRRGSGTGSAIFRRARDTKPQSPPIESGSWKKSALWTRWFRRALERFGAETDAALVAETAAYRVYQVRWPVLDGVYGEGLLLEPQRTPVAHVVALPDADQTPEQLAGLAPGVRRELAVRAAPGRERLPGAGPDARSAAKRSSPADPQIRMTDQTHREWIYRQAFHMGRHVIGYEVQKVLRRGGLVQRARAATRKVGVAGYAEGGLIAFYAAAADTRIDAALVSGYFDSRQQVWAEPIYRNVWGLLDEFGDAEIAIAHRCRAGWWSNAVSLPKIRSTKGRYPAACRFRQRGSARI